MVLQQLRRLASAYVKQDGIHLRAALGMRKQLLRSNHAALMIKLSRMSDGGALLSRDTSRI